MRRLTEQDFWSRIGKGDACWEWNGPRTPTGYGYVGKQDMAHRYSYRLHFGDLPVGAHVLHSCDNPPCVNPQHLRIGTHAENLAESSLKLRMHPKLTPQQVRNALDRHQKGESFASIARSLGVGETSIAKIIKGKTWKWMNRRNEEVSRANS